jgi:hypothetical protein
VKGRAFVSTACQDARAAPQIPGGSVVSATVALCEVCHGVAHPHMRWSAISREQSALKSGIHTMTTNIENHLSSLSDEALDGVAGGFSFFDFFPKPPSLSASVPTPSSFMSTITNYAVAHNPVAAIGRALKFW